MSESMNEKQFEETRILFKMHKNSGVSKACKLVLVDKMSIRGAANKVKCDAAGVSRALKRIRGGVCECCGKPKE